MLVYDQVSFWQDLGFKRNKHMCNLHYVAMLNIFGKILKSLIVNVDFESSNYCIPCRHRLLGQTTKQPLSDFEPKKP